MTAEVKESFCLVHGELKEEIKEIKIKQDSRHCIAHDVQINHILRDVDELQDVDSAQWTAINNLRRLVYIGMGGVFVTAGLGSFIGQLVINYLKK